MSEKKVCGNLIYHIDEHNFLFSSLKIPRKKVFSISFISSLAIVVVLSMSSFKLEFKVRINQSSNFVNLSVFRLNPRRDGRISKDQI